MAAMACIVMAGPGLRIVWEMGLAWWESVPRACGHRDLVAATDAGYYHALRDDIECLGCQGALRELYHALDYMRGYCDYPPG